MDGAIEKKCLTNAFLCDNILGYAAQRGNKFCYVRHQSWRVIELGGAICTQL